VSKIAVFVESAYCVNVPLAHVCEIFKLYVPTPPVPVPNDIIAVPTARPTVCVNGFRSPSVPVAAVTVSTNPLTEAVNVPVVVLPLFIKYHWVSAASYPNPTICGIKDGSVLPNAPPLPPINDTLLNKPTKLRCVATVPLLDGANRATYKNPP